MYLLSYCGVFLLSLSLVALVHDGLDHWHYRFFSRDSHIFIRWGCKLIRT
jgi:hypothetical protein